MHYVLSRKMDGVKTLMYEPNKIVLKQKNARAQRGQILPLVAIALTALIGFMALAIDVGYLLVVRNELQNAADAAVLAGAGYLYQNTPPAPNWSLAQSKASEAITLNKTGGVALTDGQVEYGYWNLTGSPAGLQSSSITPGPDDYPALKVTISKASGQNLGEVNTFFARVIGIASYPVSAKAVAVVASPGYAKNVFPVAIPKCIFDNFWDSQTNTPKINPVTDTYDIIIGSSYHYPGCGAGGIAGQWTSLDLGDDSVPVIRSLIDQASGKLVGYDTTIFNIGDNIWIEPGTKTTLYSSVDACSARGDKSCEYMALALVCSNPPQCNNITTHVEAPIMGFACIRVLKADGGSTKTITVQMVATGNPNCKTPNAGGSGPAYGLFMPPRLAM